MGTAKTSDGSKGHVFGVKLGRVGQFQPADDQSPTVADQHDKQ